MFETTFKKKVFANSDQEILPKNNKTKGSEIRFSKTTVKHFVSIGKPLNLNHSHFPGTEIENVIAALDGSIEGNRRPSPARAALAQPQRWRGHPH